LVGLPGNYPIEPVCNQIKLITYAVYRRTRCVDREHAHASMPVTRSVSATRSVDASQRGGTLALRIQFKGYNGQKVLRTSQDDVQSLVPWLKSILTTLHLPHPKPSNVIKNVDTSSIIEMFWDHAESTDVRVHVLHLPFSLDVNTTQALEANVINRLKKMEGSTLQQMSM
jgi:hypothetical protein